MKKLIIGIFAMAFGSYAAWSATNYIMDVEFPHSGASYSLRLDSQGHAKREYDAFVKYPTEFEVTDNVRPTNWTERGIGTFIEATAKLSDTAIDLSLTIDDAELKEFMTHENGGHQIKQPVFGSIAVVSDLTMVIDQWLTLEGKNGPAVRLRIRKEAPQP